MSTDPATVRLHVEVNDSRSEATLRIPADPTPEERDLEACLDALRRRGVQVTQVVRGNVERALSVEGDGEPRFVVVAETVDPEIGHDGRIEWAELSDDEVAGDEASVNHYERCMLRCVASGESIGRVLEPTAGVDGFDVLGARIPAEPGHALELQLDSTVARGESGELTALADGVVHVSGNRIWIEPVLQIEGEVDFSTGNVSFDGDVLIKGSVLDRFVVESSGSIEVHGLIEGATIRAGGDLIARMGIATRESGEIHSKGNLVCRYMDNVQAEIGGDLVCEREVINSQITVKGALRAPGAAVIGGSLRVAGASEIQTLGSPAGIATTVCLGVAPIVESELEELRRKRVKLQKELHTLQKDPILQYGAGRKLVSHEREHLTEKMFEIGTVQEQLQVVELREGELLASMEAERDTRFLVHRRIEAGVVLTLGNETFRFIDPLPGPVLLGFDSKGRSVYRTRGAEVEKLATVARRVDES